MKPIHFFFIVFLTALLVTGCGKPQEPPVPEENASDESASEDVDNSWGYLDELDDIEPTELPPLEVVGGLRQEVGTLFRGQQKYLSVELKNTSDKPWKIQELDANCSCTNVRGLTGGIVLPPHGSWTMDVRVSSQDIDTGDFERVIIVLPSGYLPVRITFFGRVEEYAEVTPSNRVLLFKTLDDARKGWTASAEINGIGQAEGRLKLALPEKTDEYFTVSLTESAPGKWSLQVKGTKPLPYAGGFSRKLVLRTVEPKDFPDVQVTVSGGCGVKLGMSPRKIVLKEESFGESGIAEAVFQIGFDPRAKNAQRNMSDVEKLVDCVDWQAFFDTLETEAPEGVALRREFTRFGVKLLLSIPRSAMEKGDIQVRAGCNGNWEVEPGIVTTKERRRK